jgi:cell division protease FtsH
MVGRWGMSEAIGFVTVIPAEGAGPFITGAGETSEATQRVVDEEVRQLIDAPTRDQSTVRRETLDESDAYAAAGMPSRPTDPPQATAGTVNGRGDLNAPEGDGVLVARD